MRYLELKAYGEIERVSTPLDAPHPCQDCGRPASRHGETALEVRAVTSPPYPDALGVLFGPEWLTSVRLRHYFKHAGVPITFASVAAKDPLIQTYEQAIVRDSLRAGRESVRDGQPCDRCGGYVKLSVDPLFLRKPVTPEPLIAYLLESPGVILLREDLVEGTRGLGLDVDFAPTLLECEVPPSLGSTLLS